MSRYSRLLAQRILQARKELGWSQTELAEHVGVTGATISRWENERATPSSDNLHKLGEVLEWAVHEGSFLQRLIEDLEEGRHRGRLAHAVGHLEPGDGRKAYVGGHSVELLEDGSLLVNDHARFEPE